MDPNQAWHDLSEAIGNNDWHSASEIADNLVNWIARDGFPPNITGIREFDKIVTRSTC